MVNATSLNRPTRTAKTVVPLKKLYRVRTAVRLPKEMARRLEGSGDLLRSLQCRSATP